MVCRHIAIRFLAAFLLMLWPLSPYLLHEARGDMELTVTITFHSASGVRAPSAFSLTDQGAITVTANWTMEGDGPYVMIRAARDDYPESTTDGEMLYYGDGSSANITGFSLETTKYYASIWGFASDNTTYSAAHSTAYVGGEGMDELTNQVAAFNALLNEIFPVDMNTMVNGVLSSFTLSMEVILIIGITALAIWRKHFILNLAAGIMLLSIGLSWINDSIPLSLALITVSGYFLWESMGAKLEEIFRRWGNR